MAFPVDGSVAMGLLSTTLGLTMDPACNSGTPDDPAGDYIFETTFDLTGLDCKFSQLLPADGLRITAGSDILVNGVSHGTNCQWFHFLYFVFYRRLVCCRARAQHFIFQSFKRIAYQRKSYGFEGRIYRAQRFARNAAPRSFSALCLSAWAVSALLGWRRKRKKGTARADG